MNIKNTISKYFTLFQFIIGIHISVVAIAQNTPVTQNGQLKVCGTQLCNQYNKPIQLRGMSTHGIQWYGWGDCLTENSLDVLAYDWDADILRISLYVQEGGYETDPIGFTNQVSRLINEATERGMYALVDWHQLNPGDPNSNLENAKGFFKDIASQHKDKNNIIYDVCNEPNGSGVTWSRIKTYADKIIPVIRAIDNDAVVLVGTHGWATFGVSGEGNLQDVIDNPLQFQNVMYTFHFYANSHREAYLNRLDEASSLLPVFVTEFGSQEFTGDGPNDFPMTQRFIDLMQRKKISWTSWNYSDDQRSGAAWKTGTCSGGPWTTNQLKPAGSWIRSKVKFPADDFPGGNTGGDTQTAFGGVPWSIPGKIEAENYDLGGENIAFNDLSIENEGGQYRTDAVDIEVCIEGGYNVGWTKTGEWLEYTVNVEETKTYLLEARVAAITSGKKFHIEIDGQNITNQITVPNTGGWQNWKTVTTNISLSKGIKVLRIVMDSDDFNINHLIFKNVGIPSNQPPSITIVSPQEGESYTTGQEITISADAKDIDGTISSVSFFVDNNKVYEDNSFPYEANWVATPGNHSITTIATDNDDASTTSFAIPISVNIVSGGSCNVDQYQNGTTYQTGDEVQNLGSKFRCLVGGWCSLGGPYTPGGSDDCAWPTAWEKLGPCQGGNAPPEVTVLTSNIIYTETLPINVPLRARIIDTDGIQTPVYVNVPGGTTSLLPKGEDVYEVDWSFSEYKTYTYTAEAIDVKGNSTDFVFEVTIKKSVSGDNAVLSKAQYNQFFPYRYGTDLNTYELDPAKDFYTYEAFKEAIERMATIEVTFERRKGTNLYRLTRKDKTTNQSSILRTDPDFDASWNQSKPIVTQVIDYGNFAKEGSDTVKKRELAAFLANIAQETTGGWDTAPGGRYSWGLYFREEQGYEGTNTIGYRDENNLTYPPAPGKSYHGRGPIQLSYNYNYGQVSEFLFGDKDILLTHPERIIEDAALAFQTAIWFWMTPQYPKPSAHDVMVGNWIPSNYDLERNRKPGFGMTINIINGGVECGKGTEISKVLYRIGHYNRFSDILGVNNDLDTTDDCSECGCAQMTSFTGLEPELLSGKESNDVLHKITIELYPNPFSNELRLSFNSNREAKILINITDINGNKAIETINNSLNKGSNTIVKDVTRLSSGIYFCTVQIGKEYQTFKMIKK